MRRGSAATTKSGGLGFAPGPPLLASIHPMSKTATGVGADDRRGRVAQGVRRGPLRDRRVWLVGALILVVVGIGLGWYYLAGPGRPGGPPGSVVVEMSGDGNWRSDTFHARRGWEIQWENTGQHFSYTIRGDVDFGQVINQNGPGNGITSPVPTGNFFIQVAATGPWSITVIQGE